MARKAQIPCAKAPPTFRCQHQVAPLLPSASSTSPPCATVSICSSTLGRRRRRAGIEGGEPREHRSPPMPTPQPGVMLTICKILVEAFIIGKQFTLVLHSLGDTEPGTHSWDAQQPHLHQREHVGCQPVGDHRLDKAEVQTESAAGLCKKPHIPLQEPSPCNSSPHARSPPSCTRPIPVQGPSLCERTPPPCMRPPPCV